MSFSFTRWRVIPPQDDDSLEAPNPACRVVAPAELDPVERLQLIASVARGSELELTVEDLFEDDFRERGGDCAWIGAALETPIEWWDVITGAGEKIVFQVWLYGADCGLVFEAGTTRVVAQLIQFGSAWELYDSRWKDDEALRRGIAAAHREAAARYPTSELKQFYPVEEP